MTGPDITLDLDTDQLLFHVCEDPAAVKTTDVFPIAVRDAGDAAVSEHGRPLRWLDNAQTGVAA
ncbi:hypothetical protein [Micromonospora sp. NPDC000018]|uniref:hypothetical protein n=1 Tax=Micromonospora sp. NPDC000018 TaxID=3154239 RepID=UPI00332B78CB